MFRAAAVARNSKTTPKNSLIFQFSIVMESLESQILVSSENGVLKSSFYLKSSLCLVKTGAGIERT